MREGEIDSTKKPNSNPDIQKLEKVHEKVDAMFRTNDGTIDNGWLNFKRDILYPTAPFILVSVIFMIFNFLDIGKTNNSLFNAGFNTLLILMLFITLFWGHTYNYNSQQRRVTAISLMIVIVWVLSLALSMEYLYDRQNLEKNTTISIAVILGVFGGTVVIFFQERIVKPKIVDARDK